MAQPTTLVEYATQQLTAARAAETSARAALKSAQSEYAAARKTVETANAQLAALEAELAAIRKALAAVETPADGEALLKSLAAKIVALRSKHAEVLGGDVALPAAAAGNESANTAVNQALARVAEDGQDLQEASTRAKQRDALKAALAQAPLKTLRADADAALNTAGKNKSYLDAKQRIEGDLPAELIARARARGDAEAARLAALETDSNAVADLASTAEAASSGASGDVAKLRTAFERAEDAFREYVLRASERFAAAKTMLARVADSKQDPLTAEQIARINEQALVDKGKAAADKQNARDQARAQLAAAKTKLALARLTALASDVDGDPEQIQAVQDAKAEVATAQGDYDTAAAAFTDALKADLDAWQAAVPDGTWRLLADFEEAKRLLTALKDADSAALTTAMDNAEKALVAAMLDADKATRTGALLSAEAAKREVAVEIANKTAPRAAFGAWRGDS